MASLNALTGTLGNRLAAHLLRRTTCGPARSLIESFANKTVADAVDALTTITPVTSKPIDFFTGKTWVDNFRKDGTNNEDFLLKRYVVGWWLNNARQDNTILHKMILFNHQYWMISHQDVSSENFYDYIKLLEYYALGSYKILAEKMTLNNVMLFYLNGADNSKVNPNQNYGREFLELFTIGKGPQKGPGNYTNYTETDIQQAAKLLTGFKGHWNDNNFKDADTGIRSGTPETWDHDAGNKTFSGAFNNTVITGKNTQTGMREELHDFVEMVFTQPETAKAICRRLYKFFLYTEISSEAETDIIAPLAADLKTNNYVLLPVIKKLLMSKHFYDMDNGNSGTTFIGGMVKSPLDLLLGTMRFFNIQPPDAAAKTEDHYDRFWRETVNDFFLDSCGMPIFTPPNVAGYKPFYQAPDLDKLWFNASTLITRYKLPEMLLKNKRIVSWGDFYAQLDVLQWIKNPANCSDPKDGNTIVNEMANYILPEPLAGDRFTYFKNILLGNLSLINWKNEWNNYINTGNSSAVKPQAEKLFTALLFSQEYQCF
jgi:uncharacterized protein (DUF1800 family)